MDIFTELSKSDIHTRISISASNLQKTDKRQETNYLAEITKRRGVTHRDVLLTDT